MKCLPRSSSIFLTRLVLLLALGLLAGITPAHAYNQLEVNYTALPDDGIFGLTSHVISGDGNQVAWGPPTGSEIIDGRSVHLHNIPANSTREIWHAPNTWFMGAYTAPALSYDGSVVAFSGDSRRADTNAPFRIARLDLDRHSTQVYSLPGSDDYFHRDGFALSGNGEYVYVWKQTFGTDTLTLSQLDSSNQMQSLFSVGQSQGHYPYGDILLSSHDGRRLAWVGSPNGGASVYAYTYDLESQKLDRIAAITWPGDLDLSADGNTVVYRSGDAIYTRGFDGSNPQVLLNDGSLNGTYPRGSFMSPDGRHFLLYNNQPQFTTPYPLYATFTYVAPGRNYYTVGPIKTSVNGVGDVWLCPSGPSNHWPASPIADNGRMLMVSNATYDNAPQYWYYLDPVWE